MNESSWLELRRLQWGGREESVILALPADEGVRLFYPFKRNNSTINNNLQKHERIKGKATGRTHGNI